MYDHFSRNRPEMKTGKPHGSPVNPIRRFLSTVGAQPIWSKKMSPALLNITIPVPCVQGAFGKRLVTYTTQIRPSQIRQILGHDPRSKTWRLLPDATREIYEQIQRKTSKDRRDSVAEYLLQRLSGPRKSVAAFPSISIGISDHTDFKGMSSADDAIGTLHIHDRGHRIVLDGLGRISGCLDLLEDKEVNGEEIVESIAMPVTFYAPAPGTDPLSITELGQLFADFNSCSSSALADQHVPRPERHVHWLCQ